MTERLESHRQEKTWRTERVFFGVMLVDVVVVFIIFSMSVMFHLLAASIFHFCVLNLIFFSVVFKRKILSFLRFITLIMFYNA